MKGINKLNPPLIYMLRFIAIFFLSLFLISCDPGYSVVLNNNSNKDRTIKIAGTNWNKVARIDSIPIADTLKNTFFVKGNFKMVPITSKDTVANTYSFILEKGQKALLQRGIGFPDRAQKIILDTADTI